VKTSKMIGRRDTKKISYDEKPEEYMRVLDSCIELYKTQMSLTAQSIVFACTALISFLLVYFGAYISTAILPNYIKDPLLLPVITIFIIVIVFYSFLFTSSSKPIRWVGSTIGNKVGAREMQVLKTKLDSLYLAKIEPEKWRLIVTISREEKRIENVETEPMQRGLIEKIVRFLFK